MRDESGSLRGLRLLGLLLLSYLLVLAWCFYQERMATQDSAFFSWLIIDTRMPYAALGRVGSWLAGAVPAILVRLQAPLETVLRGYSVSIIGVHVLVFWLVAFRLRDVRGTIVLPIALISASHLMFYFGISELYQGLSVLTLVWALADRCWKAATARGAWRWGIAAFTANICAGFFHQLLVLPLLFVLVYEAIAHHRHQQVRFRWLACVLVAWYGLRSVLLPATEYEQGRMPSLADIAHYGLRLDELASTAHLLAKGPKFVSMLLLVVTCAGVLLAQRRWFLLAWSACFSGVFLVLILITDRDGGSPFIYENYYPVLAWVWGAVLADRWSAINGSLAGRLRWVLLSAILLLGGAQVWRGHYLLSAKVDYLERLTGQLCANGVRKGIVNDKSLPWTYMFGSWSMAFESALIRGLHGPAAAATLYCAAEDQELDSVLHRGNAFLGPTWSPTWFTSDHLNPVYFAFPDQGYAPANTSMPDSVLHALTPDVIHLSVQDSTVRMVPDRYTLVHVRIANNSVLHLGSLSADGHPMRLRYRVFDEAGSLCVPQGNDSELEADIPSGRSYVQGLLVERPPQNGRFRVEVTLVSDFRGATGIGTSFWIQAGRF